MGTVNNERIIWNESIWQEVKQGALLADLKEATYNNALLLSALIDLLVEKGVITRHEISETANMLDQELSFDIDLS